MDMADRPDLAELTTAQLAPLEQLMAPSWPDIWRELARSHYITLLALRGPAQGHPGAADLAAMAHTAVALTLGLAEDLGGTQPYIPVGTALATTARMQRVVQLLRSGHTYQQAAAKTGLTESRVRKIERAWRRREIEARQGKLDL